MKHACTVSRLAFLACLVVCLLTPRGAAAQQRAPSGAPVARLTSAPPAATADGGRKETPEAALAGEYRLGPGDKLRIEVYRDTQLSQSLQVRPDGKVTLPLVGDLEASGRTPVELRDAVTRALKEYMNNPVVTVIVVEATAASAYVIGGVNHPGAISLQGNLTVLQALALAGGLTDFADRKNIRILRKGAAGMHSIPFNYNEAVKGSSASVYLRAGDTVVIPD
jgi:polysaccharide export outer membrane protein